MTTMTVMHPFDEWAATAQSVEILTLPSGRPDLEHLCSTIGEFFADVYACCEEDQDLDEQAKRTKLDSVLCIKFPGEDGLSVYERQQLRLLLYARKADFLYLLDPRNNDFYLVSAAHSLASEIEDNLFARFCNDYYEPPVFGLADLYPNQHHPHGQDETQEELKGARHSAKQFFEQNGFVVVRDAISEKLQTEFVDSAWRFLDESAADSGGTGVHIRPDNPESWSNGNYPVSSAGIYSSDAAHRPASWAVREAVYPFFIPFYYPEATSPPTESKLDEAIERFPLMSSFDGISILRATGGPHGKLEWETRRNWLHVDSDGKKQADADPNYADRLGLQAFVNVSGTDGTQRLGGSFVCVVGSHLHFAEWFRKGGYGVPGLMFTSVLHDDPMKLCKMSRIICPDRAILIWEDRLFHCNQPNASEKFRFAQYVNMVPKSWVSEDVRHERIKAFESGMSTTHWVHLFKVSGMTTIHPYRPARLTDVGRMLVGYSPGEHPHGQKSRCALQ
eukprot:ANDGO_01567.mRNA.1 hypothetical protein